jgi:hypothetical protein
VTEERGGSRFTLIGTIGVVGTLALVAACITVVFLAMRSVMDIGGFCADGGPYAIETHCPAGVPGLLMGGIWIGVIAAFLYAWQAPKAGAVSLAGFLWPALFLSLGWNFLEYGVSPPFDGGLAWGWLIPGVLFVLMGGLPLLWVVPALVRADSTPSNLVGSSLRQGVVAARRAASNHRIVTAPTQPAGLVDELERLDRLHRLGSLSDSEYEAAKRRLLGDR